MGDSYDVDRQYIIIDHTGIVQLVSSQHGFNATTHRSLINELLIEADAPEPSTATPDRFSLVRTWPNPFNSQVRAQFQLNVPSQVEVSVYNLAGQLVDALGSRSFSAGEHEITWSPKGASGVYILRLDARHLGSATQRVVYVR